MENVSFIVTSVSLMIVAAGVTVGAGELRKIRFLLEEFVFRDPTSRPPDDDDTGPGQAVFICKDGQWVLAEDMSQIGFRAEPPTMSPTFEGQVIKRRSVSNR